MTTSMCPLGFLGAHVVFLLLQLSDKLSDSMFETICDALRGKHVARIIFDLFFLHGFFLVLLCAAYANVCTSVGWVPENS
jgi:hypothetical protein